MGGMNMSKLTRMQRSFQWQPYLPFTPVAIESCPWFARYNFKYDTLPIIQVTPGIWTLREREANGWYRHMNAFSNLIRHWNQNLMGAPMSVTWLQNIRDISVYHDFPTEKQARGHYWHYRTMMFALFAQFSYEISVRPNWIERAPAILKEYQLEFDEKWGMEVEEVLGQTKSIKRAGVVVDVAKTEIWSSIRRYHRGGVPLLMDVGHVQFRDHLDPPQGPLVHITPHFDSNSRDYLKEWPTRQVLYDNCQAYLRWHHPNRCEPFTNYRSPGYHVSRPWVEYPGGSIFEPPPARPWVNPVTQQPTQLIYVAEPTVYQASEPTQGLDWVQFLKDRAMKNERTLIDETPVQKQRRLSRLKQAEKINQIHSGGPSRKSKVYQWVEETVGDEGAGMQHGQMPIWKRVELTRGEAESVWDDYLPTQRQYDPFQDQWDLMTLFDVNPPMPEHDFLDDSDDEMYEAHPQVDSSAPIQHLDEINAASDDEIYVLSSQIAFIAPKDLRQWAYYALGLARVEDQALSHPRSYKDAAAHIGFDITPEDMQTADFLDLQEYLNLLSETDFHHPNLPKLSDMHPAHPNRPRINDCNVQIRYVGMTHSRIKRGPTNNLVPSSEDRTGYALSVKHDRHGFNPSWMLVVFDATTVVQLVRNRWVCESMQDIVTHLIRHGVSFLTLAPVHNTLTDETLRFTASSAVPSLPNKRTYNADDYQLYLDNSRDVLTSYQSRSAFRSGGILWRLAMESSLTLGAVVDDILDGPSERGLFCGDRFTIDGVEYYDDSVSEQLAQDICGFVGVTGKYAIKSTIFFDATISTGTYWPSPSAWMKSRWRAQSDKRGNVMWTYKDEEWYQKRHALCLLGAPNAQPQNQRSWKNFGPHRAPINLGLERYCEKFLARALNL